VKRADLNHRLPLGCAFFKEVETRFHSVQDVAARFVDSLPHIRKLIDDGLAPDSVSTAMEEIKIVTLPNAQDPSTATATRLMALVTVFKPVVDAMMRLQASKSPTLHLVLPLLTHIIAKLFYLQPQSQEPLRNIEDDHFSCVKALPAHLSNVLQDKIVLHPIHATTAIHTPICVINRLFCGSGSKG
jgi:hypothetical protein